MPGLLFAPAEWVLGEEFQTLGHNLRIHFATGGILLPIYSLVKLMMLRLLNHSLLLKVEVPVVVIFNMFFFLW